MNKADPKTNKADLATLDFKYDYHIDLEDKHSTHTKILEMVNSGSYVLELGCATGYMTRYMTEQLDCRVVGVDIDEKAATLAESFCEKVITSDVETIDLRSAVGEGFDVVIMADILEHLKNPKGLLVALRTVLKDSGFILVSIPNGVHGAVALELLDGRLDYRDTGLLDNTHLKFFDKAHILHLMDEAGYLVSHLDRIIVHPADTELKTQWEGYPREVTAYIEKVNPEYKTYQFILKAFPTTEKGWKEGLEDAIRSQRRKRSALEGNLKEVKEKNRLLEKMVADVNSELEKKEMRHNEVHTHYETEVKEIRGGYTKEFERLNKEHRENTDRLLEQITDLENLAADTHQKYQHQISVLESELKSVHAGYSAEIVRQQAQNGKLEMVNATAKQDMQNALNHTRPAFASYNR